MTFGGAPLRGSFFFSNTQFSAPVQTFCTTTERLETRQKTKKLIHSVTKAWYGDTKAWEKEYT